MRKQYLIGKIVSTIPQGHSNAPFNLRVPFLFFYTHFLFYFSFMVCLLLWAASMFLSQRLHSFKLLKNTNYKYKNNKYFLLLLNKN